MSRCSPGIIRNQVGLDPAARPPALTDGLDAIEAIVAERAAKP
jgi:hypothetical protein